MVKKLHRWFIFRRRVKVLSGEISALIEPETKTILDIGSGDGAIGKLIQDSRSGLKVFGIDTMQRPCSSILFQLYDGKQIPFKDNSFDTCMFIDVLHHLPSIKELLEEAKRVSRRYILIKDHLYKNNFEFKILKFMDNVGNKPHGVVLTYNYLKEKEWDIIFNELGLKMVKKKTRIPLYPFPLSLLFGRQLHFVCKLEIAK
jgi:ubiquinone/menaquinone biosynthesis C-methylase UbiE